MTSVTEVSLVSGSVPTVLLVLGILGALWLLIARSRRYLLWAVPICLLVAAALTVLLYWVVEKVWRPFPDPIETQVYVYIGVGLAALLLMVPRIVVARRWYTRVLGVLAALVVVACAATQINVVFAYYPTVGAALGVSAENRIDFAEVPGPTADPVSGRPLEQHWNPPSEQPTVGRTTESPIPGTASGFDARPAQIYLPPAYFTDPRPLLPVLVLLAGQPGEPSDWLEGGELAATMNTYALQHKGLAPVVVVADGTGSAMANPLCVDSPLGNVDTYLATDVPTWIKANLQVNTDPSAWAIGGLSYGGTCALQLATNHPDVYPTFIDLSGQLEPTLGDRQRTLDAAFGGSEAAFERVNPMDLMSRNKYPNTAGVFVVGADDDEYRDNLKKVYATAQAAGMDVSYSEVPGGHSFAVWSAGLRKSMDWLGARLGITA